MQTAGFTLLEVMVAFIIASLALAALMRAGASGLAATRAATQYEQAISRAQSRLDAATHGSVLTPADNQGDDGGGFHWRVRITPVASTAIRQLGTIPRPPLPVTLYAVTVWISWQDGDTTRDVQLTTEQVGATG
jgi:general secretion pathway protein I